MSSSSKDIVLVTGANSGIGYETAKLLVNSFECVVLLGCRNGKKGEQACESIRESATSLKGAVVPMVLDITDHDSIHRCAESVKKQYGRVDVLINNAGVQPPQDVSLAEQMRITFETNCIGQAIMTETFKTLLASSLNPRLIFISTSLSSTTLRFNPDQKSYAVPAHPYRVSKAALNMWASCAAYDLRDSGPSGMPVPVWIIDPGLVVTNLTGNPEMLKALGAGSPVVSAQTILSVIQGKRDADKGKLLYKDGVYPF